MTTVTVQSFYHDVQHRAIAIVGIVSRYGFIMTIYNKTMAVKSSRGLKSAIDLMAEKRGVSRSEMLRTIVKSYTNQQMVNMLQQVKA